MRLWHKDLIPVLPTKWLVAQWRELSAISGRLYKVNSPKHALVEPIVYCDREHFIKYVDLVLEELKKRNVAIKNTVYSKICEQSETAFNTIKTKRCLEPYNNEIYPKWHNDVYLIQCYYNLQEKFHCGILTQEEFNKVDKLVRSKIEFYLI